VAAIDMGALRPITDFLKNTVSSLLVPQAAHLPASKKQRAELDGL
jgi:hypothetical protein